MRGLRSAHPIELLCPMIGYADPAPLAEHVIAAAG
jgi:hypothetical protein